MSSVVRKVGFVTLIAGFIIALICCFSMLSSNQVAQAAGSHSSHHIKFFSESNVDNAEKSVNEWIESMNDKSTFNVINIEFDTLKSNIKPIKVMIWYEV